MRGLRTAVTGRARALQLVATALAAACVAAALALALEDGGDRPSAGASGSAPPVTRVLSRERDSSRWAHVLTTTVPRRQPDASAPPLERLTTRTADRTPELVLALAEARDADGRTWVHVRLPMRPNNTTGWVPRSALGRYHEVTTFLRVDRSRLRATLYDRGRRVWTAPVAVGTASAPTPGGDFYVRSRIIPTNPRGIYGVFAFGTNGYSPGLSDWPGGGVVGLHGTNRPRLIPGRVSHGCVRITNAAIARLRRLMPLGTPIEVV